MKKIMSILLVVVLAMGVLAGCTKTEEVAEGSTPAAAETKVGFIYVGPIGDGGWTYAHNEGREAVEEMPGVETLYRESVPEGPEVEKVIAEMVDQGASIIFATSFGYMDYVEAASKKFTDVTFLHCSGYKSTETMNNYFGRMYEPRFLSGVVAGLKTESNKIGYVAAFDIPEVIRGINAFTLGVQAVNPEAVVEVRWTHTWYDPAKEKEAGKALLDIGCDVIAQHQDTAGPQQAAEEAGAFAIGYNTDSEDKAPKAYMTAPVWNWAPYYVEQVQKVIDGTWKSENFWGGMDTGVVDLAPLTANAPEEAKEVVEKYKKDLLEGNIHVFGGEITLQDGTVIGEEGKVLDDGELSSMHYFIKGVNGKIEE